MNSCSVITKSALDTEKLIKEIVVTLNHIVVKETILSVYYYYIIKTIYCSTAQD